MEPATEGTARIDEEKAVRAGLGYDSDELRRPPGAVTGAQEQLDLALGRMTSRLDELAERLAPVLHPGHPVAELVTGRPGDEVARASDLAEWLEGRANRLAALAVQVETLAFRVDF